MIRMNNHGGKILLLALSLLGMIPAAQATSGAGPFAYTNGDLCLGFRKTGIYQATYECVVDLGPAINYVNLAPGTTTSITQYTAGQLTGTFGNLTNLSWSVTGFVQTTNQPAGYPASTIWVTIPRTATGVSVTAPLRNPASTQANPQGYIYSILFGAVSVSANLGTSNTYNTPTFVQEPYGNTSDNQYYGYFMGDPVYPAIGDLSGSAPGNTYGFQPNLEFTTVAPFSSPALCDLYELRPTYLQGGRPPANIYITDPHTGQTNGTGYYVGYFSLSPSGSMTFTRDGAPTAGFSTAPLTGSAPFQVVFTNTSTGTITNSGWSFGDGHTFTNNIGGTVTNTYTTPGSYTVKLTVVGPTGTNTSTVANYVVVTAGSTPAPVASFTGTPTNGFAPLTVILTDTSTGTVTNRAWSFGDGHTYTNTTSLYATNTYTTNGTFTVSLTATGPGGTNTSSVAKYVIISPAPHFGGAILVGTNLVIGGTNGPAGVQYRILSTTNLNSALASWLPVYTNTFNALGNFGYTNAATKAQSYFKLVSP